MPDLSLRQIEFHSNLVSKPVRDNFTDTENAINGIYDQIDALSITPGVSEVSNARDYHTVLRDRLRSDSLGRGNILVSGGLVTAQGSPNMTVAVSAGEAIIGGIACKWSGQNSGTITAPTTGRYDVVVINSDNTISILNGNDSADKVLPDVSSTQKALAVITLASGTTSITNSLIRDCSSQGCYTGGAYYWKIMDAVNSLNDRTNAEELGDIYISKGKYYEKITLLNQSRISFYFENGAQVYRKDASSQCINFGQNNGTPLTRISIYGGEFYGNSKTGAIENIKINDVDYLILRDVWSDGNSSSSATGKDMKLTNCYMVDISGGQILSREWSGLIAPALAFPASSSGIVSRGTKASYSDNPGVIPLGGIIPWHATAYSTVVQPYGFAICDGSTISDAGSPFNGQATPNLTNKGIAGTTSITSGANATMVYTAGAVGDFINMRYLMRIK